MDKEYRGWRITPNWNLNIKGKTPLSHRNWPANRCLLSLKASIQTLGELLQKQRRKKALSGVMKTFHWVASPPSRRPSTLIGGTQTLNHGPDNGGASLYRAK